MALTAGVWRRTVRGCLAVLLFGGIAASAAVALSLVQGLRPSVHADCAEALDPVLGRQQVYDEGRCRWERAGELEKSSYRTAPILVRVEEDDGVIRTRLRLTLPKDDPLVGVIRTGAISGDPRAIARAVFGAYLDDSSAMTWQRAAVRLDSGATTADVEVVNSEAVSTARYRRAYLRNPTTVEVDLRTARLGFVSGLAATTVQSPTSLRGEVRDDRVLRITFAPPGAANQVGPGDSTRSPAAAAWSAFRDLAWPRVLSALPWLVLVFCLGWCAPAWQRYRGLLVVALVAHAALVGTIVLSGLEELLPVREITLLVPSGRYTAGYPTVSGAVILLMAALGFLGAYAARRRPGATPTRGGRFAVRWTVIGLLAWGAAAAAHLWMSANSTSPPTGWPSASIALAAVALLLLALLATAVTRGRYAGAFIGLAVLAVPPAVVAGLTDRSGALPAVLRVGVPCLVATAALIALARITTAALGIVVRRSGWALIVLAAVATGYPTVRDGTDPVDVSWHTMITFALHLDALLPAVLLGALGFALYRAREHETAERPSPPVLRWRGLGVGFVVLAGAYSFGSKPSVLLLLAAGAFTWWLFPSAQVATATGLSRLTDQDRRRALALLVKAGEARRVLSVLRKSLRDKVAAGDVSLAEASNRVLAVEREAAARDDTAAGIAVRDRAFGTLGGVTPWARARWGAITGTVVGLPWTAFALYGVATTLPTGETYPILASLAVIVPQVVRWTACGMLFGYFLPLLRGGSSLAKALCLFVAVSVPTIVDIVPRGAGTGGWQAILLVVLQTFSFAMTLGLLADRLVLRSHGHDGTRLADVHNLGAVAAWASSLAVSAGTALATALLVGMQPFIAGTVQPSEVPTQPAVSVQR